MKFLIETHYKKGTHSNYLSDYPDLRHVTQACQHELDTLPHIAKHRIYRMLDDGVLIFIREMSTGLGRR